MRDIVDRCRVWESHADLDVRRASKPGPDTVFPAYAVSDPDGRVDDLRVAAVATPQSTPDQVEVFFSIAGERYGNAGSDPEAGAPCGGSAASASNGGDSGSAACTGDWIGGIGNVAPKCTFGEFGPSAAVSMGTHSTGLEYGGVFSCVKPDHSANRCPTLDDSFPFMLPGW